MIRQARDMVASGELGPIRLVQVEYPQDWLTTNIEASGHKQAAWRTDPERSGAGGSVGDIGTHAYQLACFVSGLELEELAADLSSFVKGRALDDNANMLLRFKGGARGMLWASQVAPGHENGLKLRVYGTKGGLEWTQTDPNYSVVLALRRAETAHHPRRSGRRCAGGARDARAAWPSGRLSRRLRQHLQLRWRTPSGRAATAGSRRRRCSSRDWRTARPAWRSSRRR